MNRGREIVEGHVTREQRGRIGLDPNRGLNAINVDLGNARQNIDPLLHLGRAVAIELAVGQSVTRQGDVDDRLIVRIGLGESRAGSEDQIGNWPVAR